RLADHDPHAMVDEETAADRGAGMDLDAGRDPADMRQEAARQPPVGAPQPVGQAIDHEGMEAGIAQHDLGPRPGGGVPRQNAVNVVAELLEQHWQYYVCLRPAGWRAGVPGFEPFLALLRFVHILSPSLVVKFSPSPEDGRWPQPGAAGRV